MASTQARPLAVVTGASSGIGFELARQFANHGYERIIAAEDDAINTAAARLEDGAAVGALKVDLATPEGVEQLYARIRAHGDQVEAVALNAGQGAGGLALAQDQGPRHWQPRDARQRQGQDARDDGRAGVGRRRLSRPTARTRGPAPSRPQARWPAPRSGRGSPPGG